MFRTTARLTLLLCLSARALAADDGDAVMDHKDLDHDNDGIPTFLEGTEDLDGDDLGNHLDLDSDGDGILDVDEAGYGAADLDNNGRVDGGVTAWGVPLDVVGSVLPTLCGNAENAGVNLTLDAPALSVGSWGSIPQGNMPGWQTDSSNDRIEVWNGWLPNSWAAYNTNALPSGSQHVELNGHVSDNLYQSIVTTPGETYVLTTAYRQRAWDHETAELYVDGVLLGTLAQGFDWTVETWSFTATSTLTELRFEGRSANNGQVGNLLDIVGLSQACTLPDTNNDGVPDFKDASVDGASGPSSSTNGIAGGLESNGRMGQALAQRTLLQRFGAPLPMLIGRSDLPNWIPSVGPEGSTPVLSTPGDLPTVTNAKDVHGVDYITDDGRTIATILLVAADGEHYEHSKPICDRAHGARLQRTDTTLIDGHPVVGGRFTHGGAVDNARLLTIHGGMGDDALEISSCWLLEDRAHAVDGERVVTAQVWSAVDGAEDALVEAMLARMSEQAEVRWKEESCAAPAAWFVTADTLGGLVDVRVSNPEGAAHSVQLSLTRYDGEVERSTVELGGDPLAELTLEPGHFLDGNAEILDADGAVLDRVWLSDGFWASVDDALWRGQSRIDAWEVLPCTDDPATTEGLRLGGCARLDATVDEFVVAARVLGGSGVDLTRFKGIGMTLQSTSPSQFCIESSFTDSGSCVPLPAVDAPTWLEIPLSDFHAQDPAAPNPAHQASALSVALTTPGEVSLSVFDLTLMDRTPASIRTTEEERATMEIVTLDEVSAGCSSTGGAALLWWMAPLVLLRRRD